MRTNHFSIIRYLREIRVPGSRVMDLVSEIKWQKLSILALHTIFTSSNVLICLEVETLCLAACFDWGFSTLCQATKLLFGPPPRIKLLPQESDATLWFGQQGKPCGYRLEPLLYTDKFFWGSYKWFMKSLHCSKTFMATYLTILILTPRVSSKPPNLGHDQGPHHIN